MNKVYILLGSNMGDSLSQISKAIVLIEASIGSVSKLSSIYITQAWGNTNQPDFLNQVIIVNTHLSANQTMATILQLETKMGRVRTVKNAPRIIDIDILFFNQDIIEHENLTIPHPQIPYRRFVLVPLNELSPNMVHPTLNKTIHELFMHCADTLNVKKF